MEAFDSRAELKPEAEQQLVVIYLEEHHGT